MNQLQLNVNKAVMEKYGPLSPEANFLSELYAKVKQTEEIPDRRTIYSIEVTENLSGQKNKHWRWAGTLAQFEKDVKEYIGSSEGDYRILSANKIEWRSKEKFGCEQDITVFHAVKEKF